MPDHQDHAHTPMTDHIRDRVATAICAADPNYLAMADAAIVALEEAGYRKQATDE